MTRRISRRTFLTATGMTAAAAATVALMEWQRDDRIVDPVGSPTADREDDIVLVGTRTPTVVRDDEAVDAYVATAPRVLKTGQTENVSIVLFRNDAPSNSTVTIALRDEQRVVAESRTWVAGRGAASLAVPPVPSGEYTLEVSAKGFRDRATLRVEDGTLVFIETDKPIYKPGQIVHIRVLALDAQLRPAGGEAIVEALDAQGIKVFRKSIVVDDFGMASLDLPLSTEPNLGVWKLRASLGNRQSEIDVRVERYVLPKYEVRLELAKPWALPNETISGTVAAEYSFGKPVRGELELVASRYVGVWEEYARVTLPIEGGAAFDVPPVEYVAGSPMGGGMGSVQLDVTVVEQGTGYEGTTSELVTIATGPVVLRLIPESTSFKPGLAFALLVVAETPDQQPVDADVDLRLYFQDENYNYLDEPFERVEVRGGVGRFVTDPPADATMLYVEAVTSDNGYAWLSLSAGYSPSGNFIQVRQESQGPLNVGETARFRVDATREAKSFYYEVLARGMVVFSDVARQPDIDLTLTPQMAPEGRLLVYQILPDGEVAADYLPFSVQGAFPHAVQLTLSAEEVRPGDEVGVSIQAEGEARVGLAAVDRSVFILAENRLNLQQVFDELERLSLMPQAELHDAGEAVGDVMPWGDPFGFGGVVGAAEVFEQAGVVVLTNRSVPEGKEFAVLQGEDDEEALAVAPAAQPTTAAAAGEAPSDTANQGAPLAEVQRIRQYFPETWLWADLTTDGGGRSAQRVVAPDSITTWMFRAVALSKERGLGIAETELRVFQPFFVQVDLPYAVSRGEEFPAKIALYNYQASSQEYLVELERGDWFDLLSDASQSVTVGPNEVGVATFSIRPVALGVRSLKVTARGTDAADAIVKELIVEPEGIAREQVQNLVISPDTAQVVDLSIPDDAVDGSQRAFVAITGNVLSQTIEGLDALLQMPFGCGEQNMILFAPDVYISRYLNETGQINPEISAKAETLMLTGYQRELTYRRSDGSFSAFGESDAEGSLWLTAFVLKTFAQARDLIYIDESVLGAAGEWIRTQQKNDGSFAPVCFLYHEDLLGGLQGATALTAFMAIALVEAGLDASAAITYLEEALDQVGDDYSLAITTYALALADSGRAQVALDKLMDAARIDDQGLHWGETPLLDQTSPWEIQSNAAIETTGYATLALLQRGDLINAASAVRWLAAQRNAYGGFGSTQDTIVALQAMTSAAASTRADIDAAIVLRAGAWSDEVLVDAASADIMQIIEVPAGSPLTVDARGRGQVMVQAVLRYNVLTIEATSQAIFELDVDYGAEHVEVDDRITVSATLRFTPPEPVTAGMIVLDVAVPTGFAPVTETLENLLAREPKLKRWDLAGRKVILYIEDMRLGEQLTLSFEAQAQYPVRAEPVASQVYAYYRPEWKAESLGGRLVVT